MSMAAIGKLLSFSDFIQQYSVEIPRIQRDYTYGAGTEKTEKVISALLESIYVALTDPTSSDLILDFVYGSKNRKTMFEPLDGQQRITTLFLLHLYACWKSGKDTSKLSFRYATRDNTSIFCSAISNKDKFVYKKSNGLISEQIKDCSFFQASFNDDPSIASMLIVLDKIDAKFSTLAEDTIPNLYERLTSDCKIKFYCLDFGGVNEFKLSNDLYIKMNSRGKSLTDYEIFKSQIEKYIEKELGDKELMYTFAQSFDTDFTDLVWSENEQNDRYSIDNSLLTIFKNLLSIRNFQRGFRKNIVAKPFLGDYLTKIDINDEARSSWTINKEDIEFILDFLKEFHNLSKITGMEEGVSANDTVWGHIFYKSTSECADAGKEKDIRLFNTSVNMFRVACSKQKSLTSAELLMLYAQYYALKKHPLYSLDDEEIRNWKSSLNCLRHIRNLIENSDDELRPDFFPDLMVETEKIINGDILSLKSESSRFNKIQFSEELKKAQNPTQWEQLYEYENHAILRGALSLFARDRRTFDVDEPSVFQTVLTRLEKFKVIFDDSILSQGNGDRILRASFISHYDYTQKSKSDVRYRRDSRMYGCIHGSWRLLFTTSDFYIQDNVIKAIDNYPIQNNHSIKILPPTDWRYYLSNKEYYNNIYFSYNGAQYGLVHFVDYENKPLEAYLLQSTSCADDNVMWKMLNRILWERLWWTRFNDSDRQRSELGNRKGRPEIFIRKEYKLDAVQDGWRVIKDEPNYLYDELQKKGYLRNGEIIIIPPNTDFIEFGMELYDNIQAILYPQSIKPSQEQNSLE